VVHLVIMKNRLIIQGPYYNENNISTKKSIESAVNSRLFSSICLSTYENPELNNLKNFNIEILINDDPGCKSYDPYRDRYNNNNRQRVTLTSAIIEDKFDFTMKIRSDCYIKDFNKLESVINRFMLSSKDFLFCDTTSVDHKISYQRILYHLSDWVIGFKKSQDTLIKSLPNEDEEKNTKWVLNLSGPLKEEFRLKKGSTRYGTEQWIMLNIFQRNNFPLKHSYDYTESSKDLYEKDLLKAMCVPLYKMGIRSMKYTKIHYPHYDRYENYLSMSEKIIYKVIGILFKIALNTYAKLRGYN